MSQMIFLANSKPKSILMASTVSVLASLISVTSAFAATGEYETPTGFNLQSGSVNTPVLSGTNNENMNVT